MELKLDEYSLVLFIKVLLGAPNRFQYHLKNNTTLNIYTSANREIVRKEIYEWLNVDDRKDLFLMESKESNYEAEAVKLKGKNIKETKMNYEFEMANFLREQKLPADENTYPPELMTQITIAAFNELFEKIETLEDALEESEDIASDKEAVFDDLEDKFEDLKELFINLRNLKN